MDKSFFTVTSPKNPLITIEVAAGHFATSNSHISHYIDISELKSCAPAARDAARELVIPYLANTPVDVIVCMNGIEIIAAYMAGELLQAGLVVMNAGSKINVITPMHSTNGSLIFHENVQKKIMNKNIVLMVASIYTGATVNRAIECVAYYGGKLVGISAVFSTAEKIGGWEVDSLFSREDIADYFCTTPSECVMCREGRKLDAIINSEGYTKI